MYKQDPNNPKKQIPDVQGNNRHDRYVSAAPYALSKSPNFVHCNADVTLGFFMENSASYSTLSTAEGTNVNYSGSAGYGSLTLKAGQTYNIHPIAVSGSAADVAKIKFVYKSGLATGGF